MLSVAEAIAALRGAAGLVRAPNTAPWRSAWGRVLAEDVQAGVDVPPADNSAMDGYATAPRRLAGQLDACRCSSVSGSLPATRRNHWQRARPRVFSPARKFPTVPIRWSCRSTALNPMAACGYWNCRAGAPISGRAARTSALASAFSRRGQRLRAQDLGLLASIGLARVPVRRRLKIAVISNGDELVEPGKPAGPGQIYNSNRYLLKGLFRQWGFETLDLGIAPDRPEPIRALFAGAAARADVLVSSGGVSVGEEDHIKAVVAEMGQLDLWKVAIKPGKPMAFGQVDGTPFLGLPGNPASVLVTALVLARPFLFDCQGTAGAEVLPLPLAAGFTRAASTRQEYLRARRGSRGLELYPNQSSGVLLSASWGDGLVVQYPGRDINAGEPADFLPYALLG